jgi:hypothetical protein
VWPVGIEGDYGFPADLTAYRVSRSDCKSEDGRRGRGRRARNRRVVQWGISIGGNV